MHITKERLQQIIKEEVENVKKEEVENSFVEAITEFIKPYTDDPYLDKMTAYKQSKMEEKQEVDSAYHAYNALLMAWDTAAMHGRKKAEDKFNFILNYDYRDGLFQRHGIMHTSRLSKYESLKVAAKEIFEKYFILFSEDDPSEGVSKRSDIAKMVVQKVGTDDKGHLYMLNPDPKPLPPLPDTSPSAYYKSKGPGGYTGD